MDNDNDNGTVLICDCTCGYKDQKLCGHKWDGLTIEFDTPSGSSVSSVTFPYVGCRQLVTMSG